MRFVAVTGLAAEHRIASRAGLHAAVAAGGSARCFATVERFARGGARGLVSFGICGGLNPALATGMPLLSRAVHDEEGQRYSVDEAWHAAVAAALRQARIPVSEGAIVGTDSVIATPAGKASLFRTTGAAAADLESHVVAQAARRAEIPFIVLRVIADPAWRGLPAAALAAIDAEGRPMLHEVLRSVASQPGQIPDLIRVALETRRALRVLRRAAHILADTVS